MLPIWSDPVSTLTPRRLLKSVWNPDISVNDILSHVRSLTKYFIYQEKIIFQINAESLIENLHLQ